MLRRLFLASGGIVKLIIFMMGTLFSFLAHAEPSCAVGGREQTGVVAVCRAERVLRDAYGWNYQEATLELVKAHYFDCVGGQRVPGNEFFATVETDGRMLALDVEGDWAVGKVQRGTWSSEDAQAITIQQQLKGDKDLFQVNFNKKTNKLRYIMRHKKLRLFKKVVADVIFDCRNHARSKISL